MIKLSDNQCLLSRVASAAARKWQVFVIEILLCNDILGMNEKRMTQRNSFLRFSVFLLRFLISGHFKFSLFLNDIKSLLLSLARDKEKRKKAHKVIRIFHLSRASFKI